MDWKKLRNRVYNWEDLQVGSCCSGDMVIVLYGQGVESECQCVNLVVGILENKFIRSDGHYSWSMGKHFVFKPDPHYSGHMPEYTIEPPQGEGLYCGTGFQSFTQFTYARLKEGLRILGYQQKALSRGEYAVRCVFGD